ncbi:MAG: DUF3466 family protein [Planctomycetes bacterium]|nr:DUF3466 family protein [Planctomycetota bacterium]NOG55893.1 DUF3466 family protein [Planctomycetota bacterium]
MGNLGGTYAEGAGLNNRGWVTGFATFPGDVYYHAFLSNGKEIRDLGTLGGTKSRAYDVNDFGEAVGWSTEAGGSFLDERAFLWRPDEGMIYLGSLGGTDSEAHAINNSGTVVGWAEFEIGYPSGYHAFAWHKGRMLDLGALYSETWSVAWDVNETGVAAGYSGYFDGQYESWRAVMWTAPNELINLGVLGEGFHSKALGLNDIGQVVGESNYRDGLSGWHAFLWQDGVMQDIHGGSGLPNSGAWDVNNDGVVVGGRSEYPQHEGFIWTPSTGMLNLTDLRPQKSGWIIVGARDINDFGQITGEATRTSVPDATLAFLMSPVYPSFDLSQPSPAVAGKMNGIRATNVEPGAKVYFVYGFEGGGTLIPTCDVTVNALQIDNAQVAGSAIADVNGVAELRGRVAKNMSGRTLLFQALIPSSCEISNLVVQRFE